LQGVHGGGVCRLLLALGFFAGFAFGEQLRGVDDGRVPDSELVGDDGLGAELVGEGGRGGAPRIS